MAYAVLSQEFLIICLLFAEGDLDIGISELITRVETFQNAEKKFFGVSEDDFRGALYKLIFFHASPDDFEEKVRSVKLRNLAPEMLNYHELYSNDEGECWIRFDELGVTELSRWQIKSWYGYDEDTWQKRKGLFEGLKVLFTVDDPQSIDGEAVRNFLAENSVTIARFNHNGEFYGCG